MIDWMGLMRFSVRELGIAPSEFWGMTLKELLGVVGAVDLGVSKDEVRELMVRFPDKD